MKIKKDESIKYLLGGSLITLGLVLGGCSSSSNNDNTEHQEDTNISQTLNGTAAIGSPIVGGAVTAKCSDSSGFIDAIITQANGTWSGNIANGSLPCAIQVTGGGLATPLHSFATQAGNINITPLTDLALALQVNTLSGQNLTDWFAAPNSGSADLSSIASSLTTAADVLRTAMSGANFSLPDSWTAGTTAIFNTIFSADPVSDPYDQLLENLAKSITDDVNLADYSALVSSLIGGGTLPDAPDDDGTGNSDDPLNGGLGITGIIDGIRYTNSISVDWNSFNLSAYAPHPSIDGAIDSKNYWRLWYLPKAVGSYQCKAKVQSGTIQLSHGGTDVNYPQAKTCEIEVISINQGLITGSFTGKIVVGTEEYLIEDGLFRYQTPSL